MSDSPTSGHEGTHILQPLGPKVSAAVVIVAAGNSTRMGLAEGERKPQLLLEGLPILERTCALFNSIDEVSEIILVAFEDDIPTFEQWTVDKPALDKVRVIIPGGAQRADSVRAGVFWCSFDLDVIAVHDGARPLTDPAVVLAALHTARTKGAALVAAPVHDTIKESDNGRTAARTLDRSKLWARSVAGGDRLRHRPGHGRTWLRCLGSRAGRSALSHGGSAEGQRALDD